MLTTRARMQLRRGRLIAVLVAAGLAMAACGDDGDEAAGLPETTATPSVTQSPEAAVESAYRSYEKTHAEMAASGDLDAAKLRPYATAALAQKDVEGLSFIFDEGNRIVGEPGITVTSVDVVGEKATLDACLDANEVVMVEAGATPGPDATGQGSRPIQVQLVMEADGWRVSGKKPTGPTC